MTEKLKLQKYSRIYKNRNVRRIQPKRYAKLHLKFSGKYNNNILTKNWKKN